jgi:hypothetical protein
VPALPDALVGRRVLRQFDSGVFVGVVVGTRSTRAYGQLWHVCYGDGDEEDLNAKQRQGALLPADAGALPDAAGAGGSDAACVSPMGTTAALLTVGAAAVDSKPPAPERHYKGVSSSVSKTYPFERSYVAELKIDGGSRSLGSFCTAVEAARAYDAAARARGRLVVNFPRTGSDEKQAVLRRTAGRRAVLYADVSRGHAAARQYKGVQFEATRTAGQQYRVELRSGGVHVYLGGFATALDAARAYDKHARSLGRLQLNFPNPGTAEAQATRGVVEFSGVAVAPSIRAAETPRHKYSLRLSTAVALDPPPAPATGACRPAPAPRSKRSRTPDEDAAELLSVVPELPAKAPHSVHCVRGAEEAASRRFKGVRLVGVGRWQASVCRAGKSCFMGRFASAVEAAHVYDQAMRASGVMVVNFPRDGTAEVQAVAGVMNTVTLAAAAPPHRSGTPPPNEHAAAAAAGGTAAAGVDALRCSQPHKSPIAVAQRQALERHACARASSEEGAAELPSPATVPAAAVSPPRTAPPASRAAHTHLHSPSSSADAAAHCSPAAAAAPAAEADADDEMVDASPLDVPRYIVPPLAAAGPLQAGGASTPLEVPPDCPASLVGRRVMCTFPEGVLSDAVIHTRATQAHSQLWCVALEDGEEEELTWSELCAALQPVQQPAAAVPHDAASPVAPPATAAASPEGDAKPAEDASSAPVAAFLRAITPPLSQLAAALAALPASGVSMAHLACIASSPHTASADRKMLFDELTAGLGLTRAADRFAFMHAVLALAPCAVATRDA